MTFRADEAATVARVVGKLFIELSALDRAEAAVNEQKRNYALCRVPLECGVEGLCAIHAIDDNQRRLA